MLDSWYKGVCSDTLCKGFANLHIGLICSKDIVSELMWLVQMQLCKLKSRCHILFRVKGFFLATLPRKPYFFTLFLIVQSGIHTFNVLKLNVYVHYLHESCSLHDMTCIKQSDLGLNLLGQPLLGRQGTFPRL